MSFDLHLLGSKLKKYREQFQLSISDIASETGIANERLAAFENGQYQPTGDEILILADYYKCDYKFFISNEQVAPFEQTEMLFRRYGAAFSKEDRWCVQEFLFLCECEEFLMQKLGQDRKPFSFQKRGDYYKQHGWSAAADLRHHIAHSPYTIDDKQDIYRDFRIIGLHVFRRELQNSNISGMFVKHPTAGKCILINYSEDMYRQRFSAAHEAAHAILDDEQEFVVSFADYDNELSEVRANNFASHYLLPPDFLRSIPDVSHWNQEKVIEWANRSQVSTEVLAIALKSMDLISPEVERYIKSIRVPAKMKRDPELPADLTSRSYERRQVLLQRGLSTYYVKLCFDAYEQSLITAGRVAEMLLVDEREITEIAHLFGRSMYYAED